MVLSLGCGMQLLPWDNGAGPGRGEVARPGPVAREEGNGTEEDWWTDMGTKTRPTGPDTIADADRYVINPMVRLRAESHGVGLYKFEERKQPRAPSIVGIVLALCDGKNTIADVARLCVPLIRDREGEERQRESLRRVRTIVAMYHGGGTPGYAASDYRYFEHASWLVPADTVTSRPRFRVPSYDPRQFLPENAPRGRNSTRP
jgi:hypothetical protein